MPKKISEKERQAIVDLLPTGKSCREIAREVGRSPSTVGKVAREEGHTFGHLNLLRAYEARKAYGKEHRSELVAQLHEKILGMLSHFEGEHLVYNFGGRDNEYNEHLLKDPPVDVKQTAAKTIHLLQKTIIETLKYDEPKEGVEVGSDFDRWMEETYGVPQ